jgi:dihydrofolate reductase
MNVFIIAALTTDGFIGRDATHTSIDWTSVEDKHAFRAATKDAGVMVMGSRTFATINRSMPGRKIVVYTTHPQDLPVLDGVEATDKSPAELLRQLESEGYTQVAICGGSSVYTQFLQAGVVDELHLTIEPILFGKGVTLFNDTLDIKLELDRTKHLNQHTLQLVYRVVK